MGAVHLLQSQTGEESRGWGARDCTLPAFLQGGEPGSATPLGLRQAILHFQTGVSKSRPPVHVLP